MRVQRKKKLATATIKAIRKRQLDLGQVVDDIQTLLAEVDRLQSEIERASK